MKIEVNKTQHAGVPLRDVAFGSVVTRSIMGEAVYNAADLAVERYFK